LLPPSDDGRRAGAVGVLNRRFQNDRESDVDGRDGREPRNMYREAKNDSNLLSSSFT